MDRLLAKSSRTPDAPEPFETLPGHLELVALAARQITQEVGPQVLAALGLDSDSAASLTEATVLAALLHDIGKANEDFQLMVRARGQAGQALRHEVVGLWLLCQQPALADWIFTGIDAPLQDVVLRAVVGHHLKFHSINALQPQSTGRLRQRVFAGHEDFRAALDVIRRQRGLGPPPDLADLDINLYEPLAELEAFLDLKVRDWKGATPESKALSAAVNALLIAADVCGSALSRTGDSPEEWLSVYLREVCTASDLHGVASRGFRGKQPRPFQVRVADSASRVTLVQAGCGTGKTAAAYLWSGRNAPERKLFFCYPTTGTASEGFSGYWDAHGDAALVHSRALYDIERICHNGRDEDALVEAQAAYRGLAPLAAKATVCTVDTVLGLLQNHRTGLTASPAILGGAFVFDEIHLYDDELFGTLLRFLQAIRGAPILLMTASLQPSRFEAIKRSLDHVGEHVQVVEGPRDIEALPRYVITQVEGFDARARVDAALAAGQRVLWVANTVDGCIEVAREFEAKGARVEAYHSRFRYMDRVERHDAVTRGFGHDRGGQPLLAVTTQVCEVSLDISADLLVSDLAPVPALVQRLGRLNRWAQPGDGSEPRSALIVEVANTRPYEGWDPATSRRWLEILSGRAVSQADLRAALDDVLAGELVPVARPSAWLDRGWEEIKAVSLRELSPSLTVIREEDADACVNASGRPDPVQLIAHGIPMPLGPVQREFDGWRRLGGFIPVAPRERIEYSPKWGARWK